MDDSMMMKPTPPPSAVPVDKAAKKKILLLPLFVSVKLARVLALFSAVVLAAFAADSLIRSPCNPADSPRWCINLTDAAGAKVQGLERGQVWVSGVQAAAALLGRLLAFIALAAGAVNLCMEAVVQAIFIAAAPGNHSLKKDAIAYVVILASSSSSWDKMTTTSRARSSLVVAI